MASSKAAEAVRTAEQRHVGATMNHDLQANPSAPLLPSGPSMEPPPYSSVMAQDSQAWRNNPGSFSGINGQQPPYPTSSAPYPTDGAPTFGAPSKAPYPTGPAGIVPEPVVNPPYPTGPGITCQPNFTSGPASQAPYPVAAMPMPEPVDANRQELGFVNPLTTQPKSTMSGYQPVGYETPANQGMIYPTQSGQNGQYYPVQNQYQQNQVPPPQTVYVIQKEPESSKTDDDCAAFACCLASCYCLCECFKLCASIES